MEPVLVTLVKHPLVWGGLGLLVRYEGRSGADYGLSAATWRAVDFASSVSRNLILVLDRRSSIR